MRIIALLMVIVLLMIIVIISLVYYLSLSEEIVLTDSPMGYYVANDGDDSNDGLSTDTPWRTIGKVNSELNGGCINAGDDIYFNRGDRFNITERLTLRKGGNASDPMIFGAYGTGSKPIITGDNSQVVFCDLPIGHIVLQDFNISDNINRPIFFYNACNSHNITFKNLEFYNAGSSCITLYDVKDFKIENCDFDVNDGNSHGIGLQVSTGQKCQNGIIRNCTIHDCKDGISIHFRGTDETNNIGDNFWIENCTIWNTSEEPIDVVGGIGCDNILIQNCEIYDCRKSLHIGHGTSNVTLDNVSIKSSTGNCITLTSCDDVRIRNCVIYDWVNGLGKSNNQYAPDQTSHINIYNNDFVSDGDVDHMQINNANVDDFIVKNNIFSSTQSSSPDIYMHLIGTTYAAINSNWTYNMWWRGDGLTGNHWQESGGTYNWAQWLALSTTDNDLRDDPEFINVAGGDYRLSDTSPCIDAGDWLTTTNGGGTGATITVHEANYFFAGFPTLGVDGDNIFVGDDTDLVITSIDYSSETITVNRSIDWDDGDNVSFSSYSGSAPDIGAYEFVAISAELHELRGSDHFRLLCLALFCFVIMTKKLYIGQTRKLIMSR